LLIRHAIAIVVHLIVADFNGSWVNRGVEIVTILASAGGVGVTIRVFVEAAGGIAFSATADVGKPDQTYHKRKGGFTTRYFHIIFLKIETPDEKFEFFRLGNKIAQHYRSRKKLSMIPSVLHSSYYLQL
jgi:hypothetical protein